MTKMNKIRRMLDKGMTAEQVIAKGYDKSMVYSDIKRRELGLPVPKRGRPKKNASAVVPSTPKRKRGRPAKVVVPQAEPPKTEHPLQSVFDAVIAQVTSGKGVRHGGDSIPFTKQPWAHYAGMHGRGFLTGQAAKKLEEAATTRWGPEFETEMLGAIVYCAMAILHERKNTVQAVLSSLGGTV